jgi:hypothetical protein
MKNQQNMVRQSVRYDIVMRASMAVDPAHAQDLRFAAGAGHRDGWVDLDIIDFSANGVGMVSPVFVPRRTLLVVRAFSFGPEPAMILEAPVRVQRVCMTDRRPAYLVGTSFVDPSPEVLNQINSVLQLLEGGPVEDQAA